MNAIELTGFTKSNGPLTKRIALAADGTLRSDGSGCVMTHGEARRRRIADVGELASIIECIQPNQAIALGTLRGGLPEKVQIVSKQKLNGMTATSAIIARTGADIIFRREAPALALIDFDTKGTPPEVAAELTRLGGFWNALPVPASRRVAHVTRRSTSAGLFRSDTGEKLPGSEGLHVYLAVQNGTDIARFLKALHERCWLAGLGWLMVGAGGQLLERSIVDRMVGAPERLVFEGGPILDPPLAQDRESRLPIAIDGDALDTLAACPPLTIAQTAQLRALKARQAQCLAADSAKARSGFVEAQAELLAERRGISKQAAARMIARQCEGVLHPDVALPFDDEELSGRTVADVLANPDRFEGATLADPLEGAVYGTCVARIMRRADGSVWIHSFAHGRTVYDLKLDAAAIRKAIKTTAKDEAVRTFIRLAVGADLDAEETEQLRDLAAELGGTSKRTIGAMLKAAQRKRASERKQQEQERRLAAQTDPRPAILAPAEDAPWLPQANALNDVIGKASAKHPQQRDVDGLSATAAKITIPDTHAFTSANSQ
jgi:hypothetical protein